MWINTLPINHWLRAKITETVRNSCGSVNKICDVKDFKDLLCENEHIENSSVSDIDLGKGTANVNVSINKNLFYKILEESTGIKINGEQELLSTIIELATMKKDYMRIKDALDEVEATGYGIVMPSIEELTLEEPEIMRQGGRYGVRLRASAPSIHMMKADIATEVSPIVGSEKQSEDLIMYLLKEFEENPVKIWDSNIFGKSLHELVNEGLHAKLAHMPSDARIRLQETLERVINEGCNGLVCIIL